MEQTSKEPQSLAKMFNGIQPSKQAAELARKAVSLGEDPTALTQRAGRAAQEDGRNKVGLFGQARPYLNNLKDVVNSLEGRKVIEAASRKANKKKF